MSRPLIIDTVGLPENELSQARPLLGGSTASIRTLPFDQAVAFIRRRRKDSLYITMVIEWGQSEFDQRLWPILAAPRTTVLDFAFVIGNMLWRGDVIPRNEWSPAGSPYDREDEGWVSVNEHLTFGPNFIIDWNQTDAAQQLEMFTSQRLANISYYGDLGNFIVLPGPIRPLQPRRTAALPKPTEPPLKPLELGHKLEKRLGWPTERYRRAPSPSTAAMLARKVLEAKGLRTPGDPLAVCEQLGVPIEYLPTLKGPYASIVCGEKAAPAPLAIRVSLEGIDRLISEHGGSLDQQKVRSLARAALVAHEVGHSFFFPWVPGGWPQPVYHLNAAYDYDETEHRATERFCETFAQAWLWPSADEEERQLLRRWTGWYIHIWREPNK